MLVSHNVIAKARCIFENIGQKYLMENTTLGIPALFQTEGDVI